MRIWQYTSLDIRGVGGVETHIRELSQALRALGHQVHVGLELPDSWRNGGGIVHTHGDSWPSLALLRRPEGWRWIHVCHGTSFGRLLACREYLSLSAWRGSTRDLSLALLADAAIAVGRNARDEVLRYYRYRKPLVVISNGVNTALFSPLRSITRDPRIMFMGRGEDRVKNVRVLLRACDSLRQVHDKLELWAAPGLSGPYPFLQNLGTLSGAELATKLGQCRALALVSFYEGDPLVVHEAKALGLPIIASDIAPLRHALEGYANAKFVNPRNADNVRDVLETVLFSGDPPAPRPQSRSWTQVAQEFAAFYEQMAASAMTATVR